MYRNLLRDNPSFLKHLTSSCFTSFSDFFMLILMPWMALGIDGGGKGALAIVMAIESLPRGFAILYGGRLSDKIGPKRLLIISRLLLMALYISFALLLMFADINIYFVCAFALAFSMVNASIAPATESIIPSIVNETELRPANSLIMGMIQACQIVAPIAAASTIAWMDGSSVDSNMQYAVPIFAAACLQLMSIILIRRITISSSPKTASPTLVEGVKLCWRNQQIRTIIMLLFFVCLFAVGPASVAYPLIVVEKLNGQVSNYGQMFSIQAIGAILGYALVSRYSVKLNIIQSTCLLQSMIAASLVCMSLFDEKSLILPFVAAIGFADACIRVLVITHIQSTADKNTLGVVISMVMLAVVGAIPISRAISAFVVKNNSVDVLLLFSGLLTFMTILLVYCINFYSKSSSKPNIKPRNANALENNAD